MDLPETVCDGCVLLHIHREIQEILIFTAYLRGENERNCYYLSYIYEQICLNI